MQKRRETALARANEDLEAFNNAVAHDLRAPLRGICGFAKILLEDEGEKLDAAGRNALAVITRNAVRMGELIDGLASLAAVNTRACNPKPTDLSQLFRATAARLAISDPTRKVSVVVQEDVRAWVDPALAATLVEILFDNAWKFTRKTSVATIAFGVEVSGGTRTFFVRDNGAGFDPAYAQKLFLPFERLHPMGDFPGVGVGLATAQRIVHRHEGAISMDAAPGLGATVRFTLAEDEGVS